MSGYYLQILNMNPLISILIPAFNAEKYIFECVNSIIHQSYENLEILIANDCSKDSTLYIIRSFSDSRIKIFNLPFNHGYNKVWNFLVAKAKGNFIAFQDSDDWSDRNRISIQFQEFRNDKDLALCGTWATITNAKGNFLRVDERPSEYEMIINYAEKRNPILGATMMFRKDLLNEFEGYRDFFIKENLAYQDYDFVYRILEEYKVINIPQHLYFYRQHKKSNSKKISINRIISDHIVRFLAYQRKLHGKDGLQDDKYYPDLEKYIKKMKRPYEEDKSKIYIDFASNFMYQKLKRSALYASLMAIREDPFKLINYRTFLYCLMH